MRRLNFHGVTFYNLRNNKANKSLEEILVYCYYNSTNCTKDDFETIVDRFGYVEYKFKPKTSYKTGRYYGFEITIYNTAEYSNEYEGYLDGFRIIVHNYSADPNYYHGYSSEGADAAHGFATNILVNRIFSFKLSEPYNDCIKDIGSVRETDSFIYKYMVTQTNYTYSQKSCFDYCIGTELNKFINRSEVDHWRNIYFLLYDEGINLENEFANLTNNRELYELCQPYCLLECDSINYDLSTSFSSIVNKAYID